MVRIWAAIATVVLAVLLAITIVHSGSSGYVLPTGGVTAGGPTDALPTGPAARKILQARTDLQHWRAVGGPAPGVQTQEAASGQATEGTPPGNAEPNALVRDWTNNRHDDWMVLRSQGFEQGVVNIPKERSSVLMQPAGRDWRRTHNESVTDFGGWFIFGVGLLLALFLLIRGRIPLELGFSGKKVLRFNSIERANHWMTATSFILMALSGLIILYGRTIIRPWLGAEAFSGLATASLYVHIAFAIPFVIGIIVMIILWLRQNLPTGLDMHWLARFGGFLNNSPDKPPARRFNAGQKLVFWGVAIGGLLLLLSGVSLMFPFYWFDIHGMQSAMVFHSVIALLMVGLIIGHIYIGTVGMVGAFDAMWDGTVDRNWAEEHHRLWLAKLEGRPPAELREESIGRGRPAPSPAE